MQVFVPFYDIYMTASCLDRRRLWKQVLEAKQIIMAIDGISEAWKNHPVTKMYTPYLQWLVNYMNCLEAYWEGDLNRASMYSKVIKCIKNPIFLTQEFLDNHKKRLYTKDPVYYNQFSYLGTSEVNMYWSWDNNNWLYYKNGKLI